MAKSPYPEIPQGELEAIAKRIPEAEGVDNEAVVALVIDELLQRPKMLLELAARFAEVRVQRARPGKTVVVDDKDVPIGGAQL